MTTIYSLENTKYQKCLIPVFPFRVEIGGGIAGSALPYPNREVDQHTVIPFLALIVHMLILWYQDSLLVLKLFQELLEAINLTTTRLQSRLWDPACSDKFLH